MDFEEPDLNKIAEIYKKRKASDEKYSHTNINQILFSQERERTLIKWIRYASLPDLSQLSLLEIGAGFGYNLLQFIEFGFQPENLFYNELLKDRINYAKKILPSSIKIFEGDARKINLPHNSIDILFQSTVFTSILDNDFKKELADKMWSMVKPGGGVLWYDFIYNNPANQDVRGISLKEIKMLFPSAKIKSWKLTLAPPLSRRVTKIHPSLYSFFNLFPFLRTHILCWIPKKP